MVSNRKFIRDVKTRHYEVVGCLSSKSKDLSNQLQNRVRRGAMAVSAGSCTLVLPRKLNWSCSDGLKGRPAKEDRPCGYEMFLCTVNDEQVCKSPALKCDGTPDCDGGFDEIACYKNGSEQHLCRADDFRCRIQGDVKCLPDSWKCDGKKDCENGEDETGCTKCNAHKYQCPTVKDDRPFKCLSYTFVCDGDDDCFGAEDEDGCVCDPPESPYNGSVSFNGKRYSSKAVYTCNPGYRLEGKSTRKCELGAFWSGSTPDCVLIDCGEPMSPENGTMAVNSTAHLSVAYYTCNESFKLVGLSERVCQVNDQWSGSLPNCIPVPVTIPTPTKAETSTPLMVGHEDKDGRGISTDVLITMVTIMMFFVTCGFALILLLKRKYPHHYCFGKRIHQPTDNDAGKIQNRQGVTNARPDYIDEDHSIHGRQTSSQRNTLPNTSSGSQTIQADINMQQTTEPATTEESDETQLKVLSVLTPSGRTSSSYKDYEDTIANSETYLELVDIEFKSESSRRKGQKNLYYIVHQRLLCKAKSYYAKDPFSNLCLYNQPNNVTIISNDDPFSGEEQINLPEVRLGLESPTKENTAAPIGVSSYDRSPDMGEERSAINDNGTLPASPAFGDQNLRYSLKPNHTVESDQSLDSHAENKCVPDKNTSNSEAGHFPQPAESANQVPYSEVSMTECNKVLSAYEIHRHLEPYCTQSSEGESHGKLAKNDVSEDDHVEIENTADNHTTESDRFLEQARKILQQSKVAQDTSSENHEMKLFLPDDAMEDSGRNQNDTDDTLEDNFVLEFPLPCSSNKDDRKRDYSNKYKTQLNEDENMPLI